MKKKRQTRYEYFSERHGFQKVGFVLSWTLQKHVAIVMIWIKQNQPFESRAFH